MRENQQELFRAANEDTNVNWLVELLWQTGAWKTAAQIGNASGGRLDDRQVRALASATTLVISGQRGYRHIDRATIEEVRHAADWLESQANVMAQRAQAIRRRAHGRMGHG